MKKSGWIRLLLIALLLLLASSSVTANENLTAHFIDVGQGDSILLHFNQTDILIDAGSQDMGQRVETYLRNHGVSDLDLVVSTHPHEDHIGGLVKILQDFPVEQVLDSGQTHSSQIFNTYLTLIDQKNIPYAVAERGQKINFDPDVSIDVLSPPKKRFAGDLNQNSIVLKVVYNNVSFLLMGDANDKAESSLISSGQDLKSDILKVGHHGSATSSSYLFLSKILPAISIISVGAGNDYGHPTQQTLSALGDIGSTIYRTDTNGNIIVTTDGQSYSISTQKPSSIPASPASSQSSIPAGTLSKTTSEEAGQATIPAVSATASDGPFVGSSKSDKYHFPSCSAAKRIKAANLVTFSSSSDARAQGYSPCGICHPP
jgi:beta-lactamase superfamily II metal-dependent hydrolase